jgi:hypothetical protein
VKTIEQTIQKGQRYDNWQRRRSAEKRARTEEELFQKMVAKQAPCPRPAIRGVNLLRSLFGLDPVSEKGANP